MKTIFSIQFALTWERRRPAGVIHSRLSKQLAGETPALPGMKRILDIGHTDLRLFFKHKSAYVWLFVMPLLFVYFMGFGNRGPGKAYNRTPPVLVENADTNFLAGSFSMN